MLTRESVRVASGPVSLLRRVRLGKALAIAICLATLMAAWSTLLKHNLARAERLATQVPNQNLIVLSADFLEYRDYYRQFPTRVGDIAPNNTYVEYYKRPLYGPISASLTILLHQMTGMTYPASMYVILSLYAALAMLLMHSLLRRVGLPAMEAALLTAACGFSFAWWSLFSVPESYSLSVCAALLAMISGSKLPELGTPGAWRAVLRHAIVAGVLAWVYLLLCGAVLLLIGHGRNRKELLTVVLPAVGISLAIAFAPHLLSGEQGVQEQLDYGGKWSSLVHFADWRLLVQVGMAFLFLGQVAPVADFVSAKPEVDLGHVMGSWTTVMTMALILACYIKLALLTRAHRTIHRLSGALLWFFTLFLFHVLFNPGEVLLYLSVPVAVLFYVAGLALVPWYERNGSAFTGERKTIASLIGGLAVLLFVVNLRAVIGS